MAAGWNTLPDVVFSEIMTVVGLESLGVLQKCRGVCKTWNVMICQMTRYKKTAIIGEAENLVAKIQNEVTSPRLPEINTIAYLAHHTPQNIPYVHWLLCSVESLVLENVDLTSVPAEHLASLASCVKYTLHIINVHTFTLINILDNIKIDILIIKKQRLGSGETRAVVRAMESGVKTVYLGGGGFMSLDIRALTQYSGHGKCERVGCYGDTADIYREEVRTWGQRINWSLRYETMNQIQIDCVERNHSIQFLDSIPEFVPGQPFWSPNYRSHHVFHFPQQFSIPEPYLGT